MPPAKTITFDELSKYFHLPINQVAKELGVCATILKKLCRRNGIPRWPHRKIKSLDKMIANLNMNLEKNPQERDDILREIELLQSKKLEIMKNPTESVNVTTPVIPAVPAPADVVKSTLSPSRVPSPKYRLHSRNSPYYKQNELETAEALNCFSPTPKPELATFGKLQLTPQQAPSFLFEPPAPPMYTPSGPTQHNLLDLPPGVTFNFCVPSLAFTTAYPPLDLPMGSIPRNLLELPPLPSPTMRPAPPVFVPFVAPSLPDWFNQEKDRVFKNNK